METLLCTAVGTVIYQHRIEGLMCMETLLCTAVSTVNYQYGIEVLLCMETLLCTAVGTVSYQHGLAACTVYGHPTVYSYRHSNLLALGRSMHCMETLLCAAVRAESYPHESHVQMCMAGLGQKEK
jgi:hypothetical protein